MTVEAKKAARSQQKAEERPTLSRCFADHQSGKVKAVRLTAKNNGVCGPGEAARRHDTPLSPVINAEDWPRSHRRRTWQRQAHSREPAWNCTDLLRPVHRTPRATEAQAIEQKTEKQILTSRKLPVSLHGPPLRQSSIQPQRQVSKQKPALSDFSNHSTRAEYCCSIQQRQAEANDIFSEFLNRVQSSTSRASAMRDARSNVTPSSHERIRDKLPLSISNRRDNSRMLSFCRANSLFTFFAKICIAFNLAIVCTLCQAVLSNSTKG